MLKMSGVWGFTGTLDEPNLTESLPPVCLCACGIAGRVIWMDDSKVWECSCILNRPSLACMHHSKSPLVLGSTSDVVCIHGETVIRGFSLLQVLRLTATGEPPSVRNKQATGGCHLARNKGKRCAHKQLPLDTHHHAGRST